MPVVVGFPETDGGRCYNALAVLRDGRVTQVYRKQRLPNYTVFDEERYFEPGHAPCVVDVDGTTVGLLICEDVWYPEPARQAKAAGAHVVVVANGSPYHTRQQAAAARPGRARARGRPGSPSSTSTASAARTSSSSTAHRSSPTPPARSSSSFPPGTKRSRW